MGAALTLGLLTWSGPASAQDLSTQEAAESDPATPTKEKKKKKKKKDKEAQGPADVFDKRGKKKNPIVSPAGQAEIKGRLVARSELRAQRGTIVGLDGNIQSGLIKSLNLSIPTARISLHYESPVPWLTGEVELEIAGKPDLKDGYAQARTGDFQIKAGQFKMPTAPQESVSPTALPSVHRGFMSDLLTDWLDVGGRRPGLMLTYHPRSLGWRPVLSAGAFQASTVVELLPGDRDTERIEFRSVNAQSLVARAAIENGRVALGAWFEHRLGSPNVNIARRYYTAGADLTWDAGDNGRLRAWLSGVVGQSWYRHNSRNTPETPDVPFAMGRALAGYRVLGSEREAFYLEPFGFCGVMDPDLGLTKDFALETAIGINVGLWRRARITVQLESVVVDSFFPKGSQGFLAGEDPRRESLYAQTMLLF
ncbi:MAG: hypothetical protein QM756_40600 [Polyangiaceae bacterium]